jgi:hypothetical protein
MKKSIFSALLMVSAASSTFAQNAGNILYNESSGNYGSSYSSYSNSGSGYGNFTQDNIYVNQPVDAGINIKVNGMANVKADAFVAVFSLSQSGTTTEEVNRLMNVRIGQVLDSLKLAGHTDIFVDMISFVPVYEFETEKKIFSKKTYNEIPAGFELKKNIHIKFVNPNALDRIISICANAEIFDLVRVDYFCQELETIKKEITAKAKTVFLEKLKYYQEIAGADISAIERQITDAFRVIYPIEMYKAYQAYCNSSINATGKSSYNVNYKDKSTTLHYMPVMNREFDFVINPVVVEPVVQVLYELNVKINRENVLRPESTNKYMIVTSNGTVQPLDL